MTILKIAFALAAFFATLFLCTYTHGRILPEVTVYLVWLQLVLSAWYFAEVTKPKPAPSTIRIVNAIEPGPAVVQYIEAQERQAIIDIIKNTNRNQE